MDLLIPYSELTELTFSDKVPLRCKTCGKDFFSTKRRYHIGVILRKRKNALCYCSPKCRNIANINRQLISCIYCGKQVLRTKSQIDKLNFCSSSCAAKYNNHVRKRKSLKIKNVKPPKQLRMPLEMKCELCGTTFLRKNVNEKNKCGKVFCGKSCRMRWYNINKASTMGGFVRSKFELVVESRLRQYFPQLDIRFNNRQLIGYELDVYLPSLKLAFEFNGPHHYFPIRGEDRLKEIQYKDVQKGRLCKEKDIELISYDISKISKINDVAVLPYWNKITSAITQRQL